jgi:hypothetical protein
MDTIAVPKHILESILESLEQSMKVCESKKNEDEYAYAYMYGYLNTTVEHSVYQLKALVNEQLW